MLKRQFREEYLYETTERVEDAWEVTLELLADGVKIVIIISD